MYVHMYVLYGPKLHITIDHIDHVNGIGNCSREHYVSIRDGCTLHDMVKVDGFVKFYVHWY